MRRSARQPDSRRGVTLLEVMAAVSLSATMMASSFVVMRSSYAAWKAHEEDFDRSANATAALRHLAQHFRQSLHVNDYSFSTDNSGGLTLILIDGSTYAWSHTGDKINLSVNGGAANLVAEGITELTIQALDAQGLAIPDTEKKPEQVQAIQAKVVTAHPTTGTRTISCYAWKRSW